MGKGKITYWNYFRENIKHSLISTRISMGGIPGNVLTVLIGGVLLKYSGMISWLVRKLGMGEFGGLVEIFFGFVFVFLILLAFAFCLVTPYKLWRAYQVSQRLVVTCSAFMEDCRKMTPISQRQSNTQGYFAYSTGYQSEPTLTWCKPTQNSIFWRLKVEARGSHGIKSCSGRITSISKCQANENIAANIPAPFAPGDSENAFHKDIFEGMPEYLDILAITDSNQIISPPHGGVKLFTEDFNKIFDNVGKYIISVVISASEGLLAKILLQFDWTGDWQTADLSIVGQKA